MRATLAHSDMLPFKVSGLVVPLYVIEYPIICFKGCCKHDMDTLSWLNAKILRRAPTLLFGRLVRCSVHGHSFRRLWYMQNDRNWPLVGEMRVGEMRVGEIIG